jgi:tellurite resistance protein TerC
MWLGMPVWIWLAFIGTVLALLALDLGVLNREAKEINARKSLKLSAFYIVLGLAWAVATYYIYLTYAGAGAIDPQIAAADSPEERAWTAVKLYITGYLVEKTLAMDNVFVISMIFAYFAVPRIYQHRVLFWGILGVIVLRGMMIGLGAALVMQFAWVMYFFAVLLIATGVKMILMMDQKPDIENNPVLRFMKKRMRVTNELHGQRFTVRLPDPKTGRLVLWATPLFLCLVLVEIADLVFAIDSVPAIFAITPDPFIVYTSNIFAILGLRALYFALAAMVHRFHYLKFALAIVLIFIGSKIFLGDFVWDGKMPATISLAVTLTLLTGGILYSLWKTRGGAGEAVAVPGGTGAPAALRVSEAMTREVVRVSPDMSVGEAAALMAASGVSGLPVLDDGGRLVGILTEGDLLRREEFGNVPSTPLWRTLFIDDRTLAKSFAKAYGRTVEDVMTRDPITVAEDMPIAEAARLLFERGIKRVPVMQGDRLVGILSRSDIVRALGRLGTELVSREASDAEILDGIMSRISRSGFVSPEQVRVSVAAGVVTIEGVVSSVEQRTALTVLADSEPGVREVRDALVVATGLVAEPAAPANDAAPPRGGLPAGVT